MADGRGYMRFDYERDATRRATMVFAQCWCGRPIGDGPIITFTDEAAKAPHPNSIGAVVDQRARELACCKEPR